MFFFFPKWLAICVFVLKIKHVAGEDKVSFQIKSFGLFGPGPRQNQPKPVSPPKQIVDQMDQMEVTWHHVLFIHYFKAPGQLDYSVYGLDTGTELVKYRFS